MFSGGWVLIKVIMFLQHLPRASTLNDHYQINKSTNDLFVTIVQESKQVKNI